MIAWRMFSVLYFESAKHLEAAVTEKQKTQHFASTIVFAHGDRSLQSSEILALYDRIGWNEGGWRTEDLVETALANSAHFITARNEAGDLVGFVRAISDGAFVCQIVDLIVHPDYRNQHIATHLLSRQVKHLSPKFKSLMLIDGSNIDGFYQKAGFKRSGESVFYYDC